MRLYIHISVGVVEVFSVIVVVLGILIIFSLCLLITKPACLLTIIVLWANVSISSVVVLGRYAIRGILFCHWAGVKHRPKIVIGACLIAQD